MPILGNIEEAGLPDVLQLLSLGRKSGCLTLTDGEMQGQIYLDVGRVSYATVANRLDRLGDMLVKSGRITQQQLQSAVDEQRRSDKRQIGRILVDTGRIDRAELERFVRLQVEQAVYFLFTWKQGSFSFTGDRLPPNQPLLVSLDVEGLLLEGARQVDEWSLIQKRIPSFNLVYRCSRDKLGSAADSLSPEQERVLSLLDGVRDVTAIIEATALSEFEVGKALYGLVTAGIAHLVERRAHLRHLEYRELLAYVVREAEFGDAARRKEAAKHIVDCPQCAERLRSIHVRRTTDVEMPAAEEREQPEEARTAPRLVAVRDDAPARRAAPATITGPVSPSAQRAAAAAPPFVPVTPSERRHQERRAGSERRAGRERRAFDRRSGLDRRQTLSVPLTQPSLERRHGPRRDDDRRSAGGGGSGGNGRDRRVGQRASRPGEAAPAAGRRPEPAKRATKPLHLEPAAQREAAEEALPVAVADEGEGPSPAAQLLGLAPESPAEPAPPAADAGTRQPPVAARPPEKPPVAGTGEPQDPDLRWLVTPGESIEMIRANRLQSSAGSATAQSKTPNPPAGKPPVERRAGPTAPRSVPNAPVAFPAGESRVEARRLERFRAVASGAREPEGARAAVPVAARQAFPARSLAVAAVIAGVALVGYLAGEIGRGARAQRGDDTVQTSTAARAPSVKEPRTRERTPSPAPVQTALRPEPAAPSPSPAAPAAEPRRETARPPAGQRIGKQVPVATVARAARPAAEPAATPAAPTPAPQPTPTVGVLRGVVRDASGGVVAGAKVAVRGTALSAVADGSGAFEIRDVPDGPVALQASADGYVSGSAQARATAGATVAADVTLSRVPRAVAAGEPDRELAAGGWMIIDRTEATTLLGGTLGAVQGLSIESIAKSTAGARTRVRVAQLTSAGERIVLTETRAGAAVRGGPGPAIVTAMRVMPASEAYPFSTATASLGNILVTAKTSLSADALRPLLGRLSDVTP